MQSDIAKAFQGIAEAAAGRTVANFLFQEDQDVFSGHFPGNPVLPGVFQVGMVKFALEVATQRQYRLARIDKCKFMKVVCPGQVVSVTAVSEGDGPARVKATLECGAEVIAKMSLSLIDAREVPRE